ncbi:aromatic amino acid DMT transporter YddG [Acinetobacter sp. ME22]|uniref:aromatic amino acid DMT transporter YddG n=1 Tax=Acinetobacter sp. ME22 TaxID=2904802 RepID=UPI001EDA18D7|nr:aromatic amino acid DMT transporter YddG [Acinetobacter sp. ME22]MCG2572780.1 aromatic amino acid DMT transporter YddG [Acinetobacter sp. ME22]
MSRHLATLIGLSAIIMWGSMVGLIKHISSAIGPHLGVTLIYTFSAILLLIVFKVPNLRAIPKKYLILSTLLFVAYELCFSFAIALSQNGQQAIEVSIVNYLWPSLTIVAFVIFKELRFQFLIVLGFLLSITGIVFIQTGDGAFSLAEVMAHVSSNPLCYLLAFLGAVIWAFYCVITKKMSQGHNPVSIFFVVMTLILWLKLFIQHDIHIPAMDWSVWLSIVVAACAIGLGYAAWNIGMIQGNITILVIASYFTPIISSLIAMFVLHSPLSTTFWQGAAMVTLGSFICWISTNWIAIRPLAKKIFLKFKYGF